MLVQQGTARNDAADRRLACTLAGVAGALNAAAFYAVGFFSANMTGNVSFLSDHFAIGQWVLGLFYLTIVLAFVAGAIVSTLLIDAGRRRGNHGIFAVNILIEGILLLPLVACDLWLAPPYRVSVLVLSLSFLMGLQNAVVTRISDARVRTTHVSGMATDIGIELGLLIDIARGKAKDIDAKPIITRLRLHLETMLSFLGGGIFGVLVYRTLGAYLFGVAALVLIILASVALSESKRLPATPQDTLIDPPNDL